MLVLSRCSRRRRARDARIPTRGAQAMATARRPQTMIPSTRLEPFPRLQPVAASLAVVTRLTTLATRTTPPRVHQPRLRRHCARDARDQPRGALQTALATAY